MTTRQYARRSNWNTLVVNEAAEIIHDLKNHEQRARYAKKKAEGIPIRRKKPGMPVFNLPD